MEEPMEPRVEGPVEGLVENAWRNPATLGSGRFCEELAEGL